MKDFEYYYNNCQEQINCVAYKYNSKLKMDLEDIKQELTILLFSKIEKIQKIDEECRNWKAYCFVMFRNHLFNKMVEEHKQGLWLSNSFESMCYLDGEYVDDRYICQHMSKISVDIKDPLLEWLRERNNAYLRKYYQEHKQEINDKYRDYRREYYSKYNEENKEKMKEYRKQYYKKYNEENKEKLREYRREYYRKYRQEHKKQKEIKNGQ